MQKKKAIVEYNKKIIDIMSTENNKRIIKENIESIERNLKIKKSKDKKCDIDRQLAGIMHLKKAVRILW